MPRPAPRLLSSSDVISTENQNNFHVFKLNLETYLFEQKHWTSGQVADDDNDRATVSGKEHVELVWSSFFRQQAQTLVPCVFECEPLDLLEVGPSSVRTYHRLDMPSATDIPAILESRL